MVKHISNCFLSGASVFTHWLYFYSKSSNIEFNFSSPIAYIPFLDLSNPLLVNTELVFVYFL